MASILTACGSMMQHMDHENYARKPLDTAGQNNFNIYEAEIFQCLRVSSGLFWRWSPYPVQKQLYAHDVLFRKVCRSIVTPPSHTDWSLEWHEILHHWNDRARTFAQTAGLKPWSYCVCVDSNGN